MPLSLPSCSHFHFAFFCCSCSCTADKLTGWQAGRQAGRRHQLVTELCTVVQHYNCRAAVSQSVSHTLLDTVEKKARRTASEEDEDGNNDDDDNNDATN